MRFRTETDASGVGDDRPTSAAAGTKHDRVERVHAARPCGCTRAWQCGYEETSVDENTRRDELEWPWRNSDGKRILRNFYRMTFSRVEFPTREIGRRQSNPPVFYFIPLR